MLRALWSLLVLLCLTSPARADLSQDIYSDAKDIITELIERDVAESLASDLACYSPEGLLKYFPNTLQSVFDRNMGAIKTQLERETVAFVANYAFECFRQKRSLPLPQFLPVSGFDPNDPETNKCRDDVIAAGGPADYGLRAEVAYRKRDLAYRPVDRCRMRGAESGEVRVLCRVVAALRTDDPEAGLQAFAEVAAELGFRAWWTELKARVDRETELPEPKRKGLDGALIRSLVSEELLSRITNGRYGDDGLLAKLKAYDFSQALSVLDSMGALTAPAGAAGVEDDLKVIFDIESPRTRLLAGALRLVVGPEAPLGFKVAGQRLDKLLPKLKSWVSGLPASRPGELPGEALGRRLLAHGSAALVGTYVVSETNDGVDITPGNDKTGPLNLTGPGLARLSELEAMLRVGLDLEALLDAIGLDPSSRRYAIVKVLVQTTTGLVQSVEYTVEAVKNLPRTADGRIDLLKILDAFIRPNEDQAFCPPPSKAASAGPPVMHVTWCALMRQLVAIADPHDQLVPILAAALDHDYRRVAVKATNAVFSAPSIETICCGKAATCRDAAVLYGRLAKTVVSYVLMPRDGDQDQAIAARAAFKAAAVDVIREIGKRGGVDRPTFSARSLLVPTGTLRAAWSGSYQQVDVRGNGIRFSPTIDWPTLRIRVTPAGSAAYLGLAFSALDGLAPFTEAVSRNREFAYHNEYSTAWATLVVPRVSGLLAIPWLTKNTALVVSAGMRLAAPYEVGTTDDGRRLFTYSTVLGNVDTRAHGMNTSQLMWQAVELSAGVQYVP